MSIYDNYIPMIEDIRQYRRDPNTIAQVFVKASDLMGDTSGFVNVRNFGAAGDGVTDDSVAIRRAMSFAAPSGTTVIMPTGTYTLLVRIRTPTNNISLHYGCRSSSNSWIKIAIYDY